MGLYFEITLYNMKTKEVLTEEHFTLKLAGAAWKEVTEVAMRLADEKFSEDKYWMLLGIKDITNRGVELPTL